MQRQNWGEDHVYYEDEGAQLRAMPRAWTSLADPDRILRDAGRPCQFRAWDLLELASWIVKLREPRVKEIAPHV